MKLHLAYYWVNKLSNLILHDWCDLAVLILVIIYSQIGEAFLAAALVVVGVIYALLSPFNKLTNVFDDFQTVADRLRAFSIPRHPDKKKRTYMFEQSRK